MITGKTHGYGELIERLTQGGSGISSRIIRNDRVHVTILYVKPITDQRSLSEYVIRPLMQYGTGGGGPLTAVKAAEQVIIADDCSVGSDTDVIHGLLLAGNTVVLFHDYDDYLSIGIRGFEHKPVGDPELTFTLRGPRDSFTEMLDTNLSLIRYRIKDPNLNIRMMEVGRRSRTRVAVVHIKDIANEGFVNELITRIGEIEIDGIMDSGGLQAFLLNDETDLFPQMGIAERSDSACNALLEGKVVIITEGSGLALVAPRVFGEFLQSCDEIYDNKYFGAFNKVLRIVALVLTLVMSPLYVAAVSFHTDVLAAEYILAVMNMRSAVPFNSVVEAFLIEIVTELLREALLRVPKQIGNAIGIVGAIIIGQAAVFAGIFSPLMLIIGSLSLLSSFTVPDYTLVNPVRILKFFLLILTGIFGLVGFTLGLCIIAVEVISTNSLGIPYFSPLAPFNRRDLKKSILFNKSMAPKRPGFNETEDETRGEA